MKNLLMKEFRLATLPLTYLFLLFSLMTFIPGYPILCGAFFVCLGIFQSYQRNREDNDILYSVLLSVSKKEVVVAKYIAVVLLQMTAFAICAVCTVVRMTFLSDVRIYTTNALMGANFVFLAFVLLIFAAFNVIFVGGFFKTAYGIGKPFVIFVVVNFLIIGLAETLHHLPGLDWLNALDSSCFGEHFLILVIAVIVYVASTVVSCRVSQKRFEKIDL
mgnify:FL=1